MSVNTVSVDNTVLSNQTTSSGSFTDALSTTMTMGSVSSDNVDNTTGFSPNVSSATGFGSVPSGSIAQNQTATVDPTTVTVRLLASPTIAKAFAPTSIVLNATSTLTFTLTNSSVGTLTNLNFTDALGGMSVSSTAIGGTCAATNSPALTVGATALNLTVSSLAASSSCTVTVQVKGTAIGVKPNIASGVTSTQTPTAGSVSNTANLTVTPLAPAVSKGFNPSSVLQGGTTQLTIIVTNPNGVATTSFTLTDDIAATTGLTGLTISSVGSDTCKVGGTVTTNSGKYVLTGGTLPTAGCTVVLNITLPTAGTTGSVTNTIQGSSVTGTINGQSLPTVTNATAMLNVQPVADLAITKTDGVTSVAAGASTIYTIRVTNNGSSSVSSAVLKDPGATGLTQTGTACTSASGNICATAPSTTALQSGGGVTLPTLASGAFYEFTVTASVTAANGNVTNTATIDAPSGVTDPVTTNNIVSDTDAVSPVFTISGQIYVDTNYGGGAGRPYSAAQGMSLRPGVRVELYTSAGTFIGAVLTDASGAYSFTNQVAGGYKVRVVNNFVTATRTGGCTPSTVLATSPSCTQLPVQTYINGASQIGGAFPAGVDPALSTTTLPATAESVASVTLVSANLVGVDFGFNFDTIVNVNDTGQGSLRQFVTNSNALSNTGLAQVGQTAGKEVSIFMIPNAVLTSGVAIINLASTLTITDSDTSIDATTQTANTTTSTGDTNTGALGTGGAVGVDNLALSQVSKPEVEITLSGTNTLQVSAANFTLRGVALHGGNELTLGSGGSAADNVLIEKNIFGTTATTFTLPASLRSAQYGIYLVNASGAVQNNLIGYSANSGINYLGGSAGLTIQNNEFQQSGMVSAGGDAITLTGSTTSGFAKSVTITGNLIATSNSSGIQFEIGSLANNTITNNTITGNGTGGAATRLEGSGIHYLARSGGVNSTTSDTISRNVIFNNQKSGVVINFGQKNVTLSQNSFYTNGLTSIDFTASDGYVGGNANYGQGNGVTPNDGATVAREGNMGQDYPVFTGIYTNGTNGTSLNVSGFVGNGTSTTFDSQNVNIELYKADDDGNQKGAVIVGDGKSVSHGEGKTYLGTLTVTLGTKGVFSGAVTLAAGAFTGSDVLTATATIAGNTSEFSPNIQQQAPAITLLKLGRNVTTGSTFIDNTGSVLVKPNETVEYCIVYKNTGGVAPNFKLTDYVPLGMAIVPDAYGAAGSGLGILSSGAVVAVGSAAAPAGTSLTNVSDTDAGILSSAPVTNPSDPPNSPKHPGLLTFDLKTAGLLVNTSGTVCFQAKVP